MQPYSQSAQDIKKAYEQHKMQIAQLKSEIAVLKNSQNTKLEGDRKLGNARASM